MSAETIAASRPRAVEPVQRLIDSHTPNPGATPEENAQLLARLEATARGDGSREEDARHDRERASRHAANAVTPQGVEYPSPVPSLPAPLVPIREIPEFEQSEKSPIRDQVERERVDQTGETDRFERMAATTDPETREGVGSAAAETNTEASSKPSDARLDAGSEQTLQSVVLAQAQDAPPIESADSEFAGRIVSVKS